MVNSGDIEEATRLKELGDEVASGGMHVGSLPALDAKPETPAQASDEGGGAELGANPLELETGMKEGAVLTG